MQLHKAASAKVRLDDIKAAQDRFQAEIAKMDARAGRLPGEGPRATPWPIAPGAVFTTFETLRIMPKVKPRGLNEVIHCISKSVACEPGTRIQILNAARTNKGHQWYRVKVVRPDGKGATGFVIDTALRFQGGYFPDN